MHSMWHYRPVVGQLRLEGRSASNTWTCCRRCLVGRMRACCWRYRRIQRPSVLVDGLPAYFPSVGQSGSSFRCVHVQAADGAGARWIGWYDQRGAVRGTFPLNVPWMLIAAMRYNGPPASDGLARTDRKDEKQWQGCRVSPGIRDHRSLGQRIGVWVVGLSRPT